MPCSVRVPARIRKGGGSLEKLVAACRMELADMEQAGPHGERKGPKIPPSIEAHFGPRAGKWREVYEALKRDGYSRDRAASIAVSTVQKMKKGEGMRVMIKATKGEGTRGGKVIGHTRSGKPIYASHGGGNFADAHKGWTWRDHNDAAKAHGEAHTESVNTMKESLHKKSHAATRHRHMSAAHANQSDHIKFPKSHREYGKKAQGWANKARAHDNPPRRSEKVVGSTRSGKSIHAVHPTDWHEAHAHWHADDHKDAARFHERQTDAAEDEGHDAKADFHSYLMGAHLAASKGNHARMKRHVSNATRMIKPKAKPEPDIPVTDVYGMGKAEREPADYFRSIAGHNVPFVGTPGHGRQVGGFDYKSRIEDPRQRKIFGPKVGVRSLAPAPKAPPESELGKKQRAQRKARYEKKRARVKGSKQWHAKQAAKHQASAARLQGKRGTWAIQQRREALEKVKEHTAHSKGEKYTPTEPKKAPTVSKAHRQGYTAQRDEIHARRKGAAAQGKLKGHDAAAKGQAKKKIAQYEKWADEHKAKGHDDRADMASGRAAALRDHHGIEGEVAPKKEEKRPPAKVEEAPKKKSALEPDKPTKPVHGAPGSVGFDQVERDQDYALWDKAGSRWAKDRSFRGSYLRDNWNDLDHERVAVVPQGVNPNEAQAKETPSKGWDIEAGKEKWDPDAHVGHGGKARIEKKLGANEHTVTYDGKELGKVPNLRKEIVRSHADMLVARHLGKEHGTHPHLEKMRDAFGKHPSHSMGKLVGRAESHFREGAPTRPDSANRRMAGHIDGLLRDHDKIAARTGQKMDREVRKNLHAIAKELKGPEYKPGDVLGRHGHVGRSMKAAENHGGKVEPQHLPDIGNVEWSLDRLKEHALKRGNKGKVVKHLQAELKQARDTANKLDRGRHKGHNTHDHTLHARRVRDSIEKTLREVQATAKRQEAVKKTTARDEPWKAPAKGEKFQISGTDGPADHEHPAKATHGNYVVHKQRPQKYGPKEQRGQGWAVTHGPSGMRLVGHHSMREANEHAQHMHAHAGDIGSHWRTGHVGKEADSIREAHEAYLRGERAHKMSKAEGRVPADYFRNIASHDVPFTGTPGKGTQVGGFPYKERFGIRKKGPGAKAPETKVKVRKPTGREGLAARLDADGHKEIAGHVRAGKGLYPLSVKMHQIGRKKGDKAMMAHARALREAHFREQEGNGVREHERKIVEKRGEKQKKAAALRTEHGVGEAKAKAAGRPRAAKKGDAFHVLTHEGSHEEHKAHDVHGDWVVHKVEKPTHVKGKHHLPYRVSHQPTGLGVGQYKSGKEATGLAKHMHGETAGHGSDAEFGKPVSGEVMGKFQDAHKRYHEQLSKGWRTRLAGVFRLPMAKAIRIGGLHPALNPGDTVLTAPEVVPGSLLTGDGGEVIKGRFRIGPYLMSYTKAARKPFAVLSVTGETMAVPFHLIVKDWADAMKKGTETAEAFTSGKAAPREGVFRRDDLEPVKWPGVHA